MSHICANPNCKATLKHEQCGNCCYGRWEFWDPTCANCNCEEQCAVRRAAYPQLNEPKQKCMELMIATRGKCPADAKFQADRAAIGFFMSSGRGDMAFEFNRIRLEAS